MALNSALWQINREHIVKKKTQLKSRCSDSEIKYFNKNTEIGDSEKLYCSCFKNADIKFLLILYISAYRTVDTRTLFDVVTSCKHQNFNQGKHSLEIEVTGFQLSGWHSVRITPKTLNSLLVKVNMVNLVYIYLFLLHLKIYWRCIIYNSSLLDKF